jgi:hypothetical protein
VVHRRREFLIWVGLATSLAMSPRNKRKVTPLHIAATERLTDFVQILCWWGADPNAKTVFYGLLMFIIQILRVYSLFLEPLPCIMPPPNRSQRY